MVCFGGCTRDREIFIASPAAWTLDRLNKYLPMGAQMKRILLASVAAAALWTAPSFAADPAMPMEEPPVFTWTGAYVGVQAGYGWGDAEISAAGGTVVSPNDPDGFLGGVYVGYNYQFANNVVLGIDADFALTGADGSGAVFQGGAVVPGQSTSTDLNWEGAARIRLGYAIDRWLPYIAGGVAIADLDHSVTIGAVTTNYGDTYVGYTLGAGVEYAFTDNLLLRAEYRFSDFGSEDFAISGLVIAHEQDLDTHDLRIGLSYKF